MKSQKTMKKAFMLMFIFFLIAFNSIALENEEKVMGIGITDRDNRNVERPGIFRYACG
jgi:hypothetical protein